MAIVVDVANAFVVTFVVVSVVVAVAFAEQVSWRHVQGT